MGRTKKKAIEPWLCYKISDSLGQRFIRLTKALLDSKQFCELSASAQMLYIRMAAEAGGKAEFRFPYSQYREKLSKTTFLRARAELISGGFLEIAESNGNLREPNVYRFRLDWKDRI